MPLAFVIGKAMNKMFSKNPARNGQPLKEFETHGSPVKQDEEKSLDEIFREAAREGILHE